MLIYVLRRAALHDPGSARRDVPGLLDGRRDLRPDGEAAPIPARAQRHASRCASELGLDQPKLVRYKDWLIDAAHGDFGTSYRSRAPVSEMIKPAFGFTLQLIGWGILLSAFLAVSVGVYSAVRQYSISDYALTGLSFIGIAMPPFWFGLLASSFAVEPARDGSVASSPSCTSSACTRPARWHQPRLPAAPDAAGAHPDVQIIASWSRFQRAAMLDVLLVRLRAHGAGKGRPPISSRSSSTLCATPSSRW